MKQRDFERDNLREYNPDRMERATGYNRGDSYESKGQREKVSYTRLEGNEKETNIGELKSLKENFSDPEIDIAVTEYKKTEARCEQSRTIVDSAIDLYDRYSPFVDTIPAIGDITSRMDAINKISEKTWGRPAFETEHIRCMRELSVQHDRLFNLFMERESKIKNKTIKK